MTTQDLSTYTEVDASNRLSRTSTTETFTGMAYADTAYAYKDFGASFFAGHFYAEGTLTVSSVTGSGTIVIGYGDNLGAFSASNNTAGLLFQAGTPYAYGKRYSNTDLYYVASNLTTGVTYYYRTGVSPLYGQYGAIFIQIYSDSGRTTLVSSGYVARTAATAFRYFYSAQSVGTSGSGDISGTNADITLYNPAAGLDLTALTEVDPNSHFTQYADCSVVTTLGCDETAYLYKDYGAGAVNDNYTFQESLLISSFASGSGQMLNLLSLVNTLGHANLTNDLHGVSVNWISSTTFSLKAREVTGGTEYLSTASSTLSTGTAYYVQINRDLSVGTYGTLYVKVFSDPAYTVQIGSTVSLTLHDNGTPDKAAFRYLLPVQSYNSSTAKSTTLNVATVNASFSTVVPNPSTIAWTQADNTVAVTAIRPHTSAIAWTQADNTVAVTAAKDAPIFVPQWTQGDNTVAANVTFKLSASVSVPQANNIVTAVAGLVTVVEQFSVRIRHKTSGAALTGLTTVTLTACQPATGYRLDFNDGNFKASPTTPTKILTEVSAANQPGIYRADVTTTLFAGWVEFEVTYFDGTYTYSYPGEAYYTAGSRANGVWSVAQQGTINIIQTAVGALAAAPTAAEVSDAVWAKPTSAMTTTGSVGKWVANNLLTVAKFLGLK